MNSSAVLTEEQRKERFRKSLQKRRMQSAESSSSAHGMSAKQLKSNSFYFLSEIYKR